MMSDSLQKVLIQKYQSKTLASLYLAYYDSRCTDPEIWVQEFCKQISPLEDHPDIFKIKKAEKETEYKVDSPSIKEFLKFINYRPLKLQKKFVFLFNANDLSRILSNKLLKVFEELPSDVCLILFVPDNAPMLATVLSRAVKLHIENQKTAIVEDTRFVEVSTPYELIALLNEARADSSYLEKKFIEQSIERCLKSPSSVSYQQCVELLRSLESFEDALNYNNSKLSRLAAFFP